MEAREILWKAFEKLYREEVSNKVFAGLMIVGNAIDRQEGQPVTIKDSVERAREMRAIS